MGLVATWLTGIGLSYAWPTFEAAGIVTPTALAALDVQMFEALGVSEMEDRRKLFYLVQRIRLAVANGNPDNQPVDNVADTVDQVVNETFVVHPDDDDDYDEDYEREYTPRSRRHYGSDHINDDEYQDEDNMFHNQHQEEEDETPVQEARRVLAAKVAPNSPRSKALNNHNKNHPHSPPENSAKAPRRSLTRDTSSSLAHRQASNSVLASPRGKDRTASATRTSCSSQPQSAAATSNRTLLPQPSSNKSRIPAKNGSRITPTRTRSQSSGQSIARPRPAEKDENTNQNMRSSTDDNFTEQPRNNEINHDDGRVNTFSTTPVADFVASRTRSRSKKATRQATGTQTPDNNFAALSGMVRQDTLQRSIKSPSPTTPSSSSSTESRLKTPASAAASRARPKSNRTGKELSAIPSDRILPMSPLIEMPIQQLETTTTNSSANPLRQMSNGRQPERQKRQDGEKASSAVLSKPGCRLSPKEENSPADPYHSHSDSEHSQTSVRSNRSQLSTASKASSSGDAARRHRRQTSDTAVRPQDSYRRKTVATTGIGRDSPESNSFKAQIEVLREDRDEEHKLFANTSYDEDDDDMRIRVVIRKRPMSGTEVASAGDVDVIHPLDYGAYGRILVYQPKTRVDLTKEIETVPFAFDNVFGENSTNQQIYERTVRNLIPSLFEGQWGCVFAYGQTGSGKTFTMMGSDMTTQTGSPRNIKNLGLYYMAALDIFQALSTPGFEHFSVSVSLFEIYGGKLFDLLNDRTQIKCMEDHKGKVRFPGLSEHSLGSAEELMDVIEEGSSNRSTGSTSRNADSSRSHAVLQLHLHQPTGARRSAKRIAEFSRLTFVDLAGNERGADTSTFNRETRMEGAEINTSLLALKEVIRALATGDSMTHVPFRGSKLTQVLKESFVGANCRSVMIACISPNIGNCEQTLNTLRYANRVKERNPESGQLSGVVAAPRTNNGLLKRAGSALKIESDNDVPERGARRSVSAPTELLLEEEQEDEREHRNAAPAMPSRMPYREPSDTESVASSTTLDEILGESDPAGKAAQQVILTHKEANSALLEIVNYEMALVQKAEAEGMEKYMAIVSEIHAKQLHMYAVLRERIQEYRTLRGPQGQQDHMLDDDEEEDLREL